MQSFPNADLERDLIAQGRLIEAGWQGLRRAAVAADQSRSGAPRHRLGEVTPVIDVVMGRDVTRRRRLRSASLFFPAARP